MRRYAVRLLAGAFIPWFVAAPASAHGPMAPPANLWAAWTADPYVLVPLVIAHWLYGRGVVRLWRRAGRVPAALSWSHVGLFAAGEIVLLIALVSPLEALAGLLLSAHMAQHLLLMTVAPLLLLAGQPQIALAWALPRPWTEAIALDDGWRLPRRLFQHSVRPFPAAALHGLALWIWHAPAAYEAALQSTALHALEHAMFFGTALLFWQSMISAARVASTTAAAMLATLITVIHTGFLGALLTFAPRPLYESYAATVPTLGLDVLHDQQLAGILMWVPSGLAYLLAVVMLAWRLLGGDDTTALAVSSSPGSREAPRSPAE